MEEDKIKQLFNDYMDANVKNINEQISGIFIYGFITGIIASYSGFLPYGAGITTGIIICKKYDYMISYMSETAVSFFQSINSKLFTKNK